MNEKRPHMSGTWTGAAGHCTSAALRVQCFGPPSCKRYMSSAPLLHRASRPQERQEPPRSAETAGCAAHLQLPVRHEVGVAPNGRRRLHVRRQAQTRMRPGHCRGHLREQCAQRQACGDPVLYECSPMPCQAPPRRCTCAPGAALVTCTGTQCWQCS